LLTQHLLVTLAACILAVSPAGAQERTGTLKKIETTRTITLGHRESSTPFSYYNDQQQVIGYSHEIMLKVVDAIKRELRLPGLRVKLIPVSSQNRIALVQNGTVDLECGSTSHTVERQKQVAFSNSLFVIGTRLLVKKDAGIQDFPHLAGKTVVTTAGTTSERWLRKMNADKKMNMNIISAKDHGESFLTLETGRAQAFMLDDVLLYGERAKAKRPGDWIVTGAPPSREAYGCLLRKDDATFKKLVDATIAEVQTSEAAEGLYRKWFLSPIPPKGLNLNFPMSAEVRALFRRPNDRVVD
jgi:glutamate/aspartate transport system substrate-binding protein